MREYFADRVGSVIQGRYKIIQFLGRGGMGAVFQCEDLRLHGRRWALKEMLVSDSEVLELVQESFQREAAMLSRLRHRNLPIITDYFIEESRQYLVMEYIEGETVSKFIQREGPADELQALRWALELAQVLDYLHRQEKPVIFRDLKPDNIIITEDRHIKLIDFGLARQFDPVKRHDTQTSGSVGYASPEQWEDFQQTDERSDVYSLGATLYFILTARPPSPVYGSQRLRPYRPGIDERAEAIVLRCLQPEPSNRYRNTGELIRDLLLWLSRQQPQAASDKTPLAAESSPLIDVAEPPGRAGEASPAPPAHSVEFIPAMLPRLLRLVTVAFIIGAVLGLTQLLPARRPALNPQESIAQLLSVTQVDKHDARNAIANGQYTEAISILDRIVTRYPRDAEAHIVLNNAYALMQGKSVYRVAVLDSLSGREGEGFQLLYGLALAQRELNQRGVRDHQIVLDIFDNESRQERSVEMAKEICRNQEYAVTLGPFSSQQTIATAPVFENAGLPALAPLASDPRVWEAGENIFTASDSDVGRVTLFAKYFTKLGMRRGVVLRNEDSIVSRSMAAEFIDAFTKDGGEIIRSFAYDESSTDLSPLMEKLREMTAVEFVFFSEYRIDIIEHACRQMRALGIRLPVATETVVWNDNPLLDDGADTEGLLSSTYFHPESPSPKVQAFVERFSTTFGHLRPSHREALAYDSLMVVARGIQEVGYERAALRSYLHELGRSRPPYDEGVSGPFAPSVRLDKRSAQLVEIRNGKFQLVKMD